MTLHTGLWLFHELSRVHVSSQRRHCEGLALPLDRLPSVEPNRAPSCCQVDKHEDSQQAAMAVCVEAYRAWLSTEARTDDITVIIIEIELGRGLTRYTHNDVAKAGLTQWRTVPEHQGVPLIITPDSSSSASWSETCRSHAPGYSWLHTHRMQVTAYCSLLCLVVPAGSLRCLTNRFTAPS